MCMELNISVTFPDISQYELCTSSNMVRWHLFSFMPLSGLTVLDVTTPHQALTGAWCGVFLFVKKMDLRPYNAQFNPSKERVSL